MGLLLISFSPLDTFPNILILAYNLYFPLYVFISCITFYNFYLWIFIVCIPFYCYYYHYYYLFCSLFWVFLSLVLFLFNLTVFTNLVLSASHSIAGSWAAEGLIRSCNVLLVVYDVWVNSCWWVFVMGFVACQGLGSFVFCSCLILIFIIHLSKHYAKPCF